jgi:RNA-directed DNA polymerase
MVAAHARVRTTDPRITPVLTLRHFSVLTELPYRFLRETVARRGCAKYRFVLLKKRIPSRSAKRVISIPPRSLAIAQRWLVDHVLCYAPFRPDYLRRALTVVEEVIDEIEALAPGAFSGGSALGLRRKN